MKIVRIAPQGTPCYGILENDLVKVLAVSPYSEEWDAAHPVFSGETYPLEQVKLLVPCEPSKYILIGMNYYDLAAQGGKDVPTSTIVGVKPTSAVVGHLDDIVFPRRALEIPPEAKGMIFECEIGVVIGKKCKHVKKEDYASVILGYTITNDVTFAGVFHDGDNLIVKGADGFAPVGPCVETELDHTCARIRTWVNGELRQDGNSRTMIFPIPQLIEHISSYVTLNPGDIIATGTPAGNRNLHVGDVVRMEIDGIGVLENRCVPDAE